MARHGRPRRGARGAGRGQDLREALGDLAVPRLRWALPPVLAPQPSWTVPVRIVYDNPLVDALEQAARSEVNDSEVMATIVSGAEAGALRKVFEDDADLDAAKRTIPCGDRVVPRPPKSELISPGDAAGLEEEHGRRARLLQKLRGAM